jgi:O-antigen/teichoic acid export membrane protein
MAPAQQAPAADEQQFKAGDGRRSSLILLNASFRAVADIGSKIATAALYLLVARKTGVAEFGVFAFALSFSGIALTLGGFGQELVLVRHVSRDHARLDALYSDVLASKVVLSIPPLLLALGIASLAGMSAHTRIVTLFMGLGAVADSLIGVSFAVFQSFERVGFVPLVLIAQRWLTTSVAAGALFLGHGIEAVAIIYFAGSLLASVFAGWLVFREIARPHLHFALRGAFRVAHEAVPVAVGLIAIPLLSRVDTTMLAIFSSTKEVGRYGAAYRLLETTAFVTWAVNTAVLPTMTRLTPTSTPSLGFVYQRALKLVLAITVPAAVGAAILATPIITLLYGEEFRRAGEALALLAPTIALYPISSLSCQLFYSQDVRKMIGRTYVTVLVENIIWNLILIPRFSLFAAAAGTSVSELLVAGTLLYLSRPLHGRLNARRVLVGPILASAGAGAVMAVLSGSLALAVPLGVLTYLILLLGIERVAFPDDFAILTNLLARLQAGRRASLATQQN